MQCKTEYLDTKIGQIVIVSISCEDGTNIQITNYGGIIHSWHCLDKNGHLSDVLLGCNQILNYMDIHPYFGTLTGRYANRIAFGRFSLNGRDHNLSQNLPPHHLHGGFSGLDKKIWNLSLKNFEDKVIITLTTVSYDEEEGYPGNLNVIVKYTYTINNELVMEYSATTDKPTPINLTNHCYFNLSGNQNKNIFDHLVWIGSDKITAVNASLVPTGEFLHVKHTPLDFQVFKKLGDHIFDDNILIKNAKGYDHNYVLLDHKMDEPVAIATHEATGRRLKVFTDQPAVQLYTGNHLNGTKGKGFIYSDYAGFCLETQHFPDSPNHPHFPNTILYPDDAFYSKTSYKMDVII